MPPGEQLSAERVRLCLRRAMAMAATVVLLALTAAACGSSGVSPTTVPISLRSSSTTSSTTSPNGQGTSPTTVTTQPAASSSTTTTTTATSGCSLGVIEAISGESSTEDDQRTASWVTLSANNWTVFVPSGDWHLSASTAGGADVLSPDGLSDASLGNPGSQSPVTYSELTRQLLSAVSDVKVICQSPNEKSSAGETQATEITGVYRGEAVHVVYALTILAPTSSGFFGAVTRSIYTPLSQWSTSQEQTLWLIIKRAIFSPSAP